MKHFAFLAISLCFLAASCSSNSISAFSKKSPVGEIDSTSLNLPEFTEIHTAAGLNVYYSVAESNFNAKIVAPSDLLPYINIEIKKGELYCSVKSDCPFQNYSEKTKIFIEGPSLSAISCSSSSKLEFLNLMSTDSDLEITTSSSARLIISLQTPRMELNCTSSSSATLAANTAIAEINASSSALVNAAITASANVVAQASSSATIQLEGTAHQAQYIASSSGRIDAKKLEALTGSATASSSASINSSIKNLASRIATSSGTVNNN